MHSFVWDFTKEDKKMAKLEEYKEQVIDALGNDKIPDCKILIAFEISCLTDAVYKLIDLLEKKK